MRQRVIIFGGRGFVGARIVEMLREEDLDVRTVDRRGGPGNHIRADIQDPESLADAVKEGDVVVNLVGLTPLRKPKGAEYEKVHVVGARNVVKACSGKCRRLVHMSALGADAASSNEYLRTKGEGESAVLGSGLEVNVFCPSVIFEMESELVRMMIRFSKWRMFPHIPARLQPVYRDDMARLYALAVSGKIRERRIEVGGPDRMSLYEMARVVYSGLGRRCLPLPFFVAWSGLKTAAALHLFGIGQDQVGNLTRDSTTDDPTARSYMTMTRFAEWVGQSLKRK